MLAAFSEGSNFQYFDGSAVEFLGAREVDVFLQEARQFGGELNQIGKLIEA